MWNDNKDETTLDDFFFAGTVVFQHASVELKLWTVATKIQRTKMPDQNTLFPDLASMQPGMNAVST